MDACKQHSVVVGDKPPFSNRQPFCAIAVTCVSAAYASQLASSKGGADVSAELSASPGCCLKSISKPAATLDPRLTAGNCACGGGETTMFVSKQGRRRVATVAIGVHQPELKGPQSCRKPTAPATHPQSSQHTCLGIRRQGHLEPDQARKVLERGLRVQASTESQRDPAQIFWVDKPRSGSRLECMGAKVVGADGMRTGSSFRLVF